MAVGFTFAYPAGAGPHASNLVLTLVAMAIGAAIAVPAARMVKMTAMPQMVAIFNGVGGGAAALISIVVFLIEAPGKPAVYRIAEVLFGVLVGCVSFSGSAIAFAKLQELMTGRPVTYPAQQVINAVVARGHRGAGRRDAGDRERAPAGGHGRAVAGARASSSCSRSAAPTCRC